MRTRLLAFFSIFLWAMPVMADTFYVGASIGASRIDDVVDTSPTNFSGQGLPSKLSLDGARLDSNETAAGAFVGWNVNDWLSLELSYTDLGEAAPRRPDAFVTPIPIAIPTPTGLFPSPPGFFTRPTIPFTIGGSAAMGVEEWSVSAKFTKALAPRLSANWFVGLTHADFEALGQFTINEIVSFVPLETRPVSIPFSSPGSEAGYVYGFGFSWELNNRLSTDIGYRKHDTQAVQVETVSLRLAFSL